mgnify:CR=1 FL=1|tara:strand:- start:8086 stop:8649 length:564 start_codon:yes stop_codon:yes gene_type:complete
MDYEDNSELKVDLVFKFSQSIEHLKTSNKCDLIFDNLFWKDVFTKWINCVIHDKRSRFSSILNGSSFSLSFEFLNNLEIKQLNKKWLNKDFATDVLSFPMITGDYQFADLDCIELGDLFISYEMALSQSRKHRHSLHDEVIWLASHGFLHLLGWDHPDEKDLQNMLDFQDYLISILDFKNKTNESFF